MERGAQGTRLQPYTTVLPKPLMPVGDIPILEIMIRQLVARGFARITITLEHLGHLIVAVISDGRKLGADIDYVREDEPRGTIGAVTLVKGLSEPFLVMNGDLLTDFDYRSFFDEHTRAGAMLSVGVYQKQIPISLGVFELEDGKRIVGFKEKPVISCPCSMGIYALDPQLLPIIPPQGVFGFDDLMLSMLDRKLPVRGHLLNGLWLDIGRPEDYSQANDLLARHRALLLPGEA